MKFTVFPIFLFTLLFSTLVAGQSSAGKKSQDIKNPNYDEAIAKGNIALGEKSYRSAVSFFTEALRYKPKDSYALFQLRFAQGLFERDSLNLAEVNRRTSAQTREKARIERFNRSMASYTNYENAAQLGNFEDQLLYLKQFLNTLPDSSELNEYQANFTGKINFANKKLAAIREYLSRTKGSFYQAEAIPYTDLELRNKFPNINLRKIPIGQQIDEPDSSRLREIIAFSKAQLKEKPTVNIADSSTRTKVACQSVSLKDQYLYFRLLIRNSDTTDFLTGQIKSAISQKNKNLIELIPVYVSDFPIVLPNKEFAIVYVIKQVKLDKNDQVSIQLEDLLKNKKFKINIPAAQLNKDNQLQL